MALSDHRMVDGPGAETASSTECAIPREAIEKQDDAEQDVSPRSIHGWKWGLAVAA